MKRSEYCFLVAIICMVGLDIINKTTWWLYSISGIFLICWVLNLLIESKEKGGK